MDIIQVITQELKVEKWQVEAAVKLIDEGNTIPFISRYRKEATGSLNDEQLRTLFERLTYLRNLEDKKNQVLKSIEDQGKLTEELKKQILDAQTLVVVEDLYRPYRPKRRTRATIAKEKGLEPLADIILLQMTDKPVEEEARAYVSEEKGVKNVAEALNGAKDIIAERISDEADYRIYIRNLTTKNGSISSTAKNAETQSVYEMYYEFEEPVRKLAGHRILALNRGEKEKFITVKVNAPEEDILRYLNKRVIKKDNPNTTPILKAVVEDSYKRLIGPAIEREIRSDLTDKAEDGAIHVFGKNLEQLLMQPPIAGKVVLGWDPAFRTGCKLAVVDPTGKVLDTTVVYPTAPTNEKKIRAAKDTVEAMIKKYGISLISVGNGTASRESEQVIVDMLKEREALPDLSGITVYFLGMAQVEAPQEKLTPKQSNNLTSIWKAVVEASGGEFVSNDYIAVSDETRTTDSLPSVSVVDIPSDTPIVFDTDVLEQTDAEESNAFDEPVALEESQVEFVADEAAYRNPEAALETIRPIADYLAEHESVSLLLVGSTAGDITDESALRLSQARADAVKKTLCDDLGIDESRIHTLGMGSSDPWHISNAGYDDGAAARNRNVTLISADTELAQSLMNNH